MIGQQTVETYWMTPAAWGAFVPFRIVHALTSSGPQVKYRINFGRGSDPCWGARCRTYI